MWAIALATLAALMTSAVMLPWSSDRPAFADGQVLPLESTINVGARPSANLAPAVRLDPPQPVATSPIVDAVPVVPVAAAATPTNVVNLSRCRGDLPGAVMTITIPDLSYSCPVYAGGQAMLDSGAVTQITDPALAQVLADHPGGPGLLWIAGHRASHGGAFAAVPNLVDGATIIISNGTLTAAYRVVGRLYVEVRNDQVVNASGVPSGAATLNSIIRPDHGGAGASRLLLQTCDGSSHRWMIYADLITG
ncbi:MAG: sortase [Ilumatobacteraceae bacterium]